MTPLVTSNMTKSSLDRLHVLLAEVELLALRTRTHKKFDHISTMLDTLEECRKLVALERKKYTKDTYDYANGSGI